MVGRGCILSRATTDPTVRTSLDNLPPAATKHVQPLPRALPPLAHDQFPVGPNPVLTRKERVAGVRPKEVTPEYLIHQSALRSRMPKSARYAKPSLNKFKVLLSEVAPVSEKRLAVRESTIQVRWRGAGKKALFWCVFTLRSVARALGCLLVSLKR